MQTQRHDTRVCAEEDREALLLRRAKRLARQGLFRKAALALRERASLSGEAAAWVALGDMLRRAQRGSDAIGALRQGLYIYRREGYEGRVRTIARMIVALDPWDRRALRLSE